MSNLGIRIAGFLCFVTITAQAAIPNKEKYDKYFSLDLTAPLPSYEELQKNYTAKNTIYDRKYQWHWNIGNIFDTVFRATINQYGSTEKRIQQQNEKMLLDALSLLPPEYYQYIGPYLHTVPGISDKVLNLPGIKETKNKFPTRIAAHVENIPDIEYLSPYLYFLLMPEAWGENPNIEQPKIQNKPIKQIRNTELYETIKNIVPVEEFYPNAPEKKSVDLSDLRTKEITANSPLTSGDIKAFAKTLPELNELQDNIEVMARIYGAGSLLDYWENEQGKGLPVSSFKDLIYPCSRLLQKMRIAGEESWLRHKIAKYGFTTQEWAYTCDKTIRAYRLATISEGMSRSLKTYVLGAYDDEIRQILGEEKAEMQFLSMQAALRMHEASQHDVLEVYKNRKLLGDSFQAIGYSIIAAPVAVSN
ncbi:MAG: hypothetical protein IJ660_02910 [Alphaproteobacteria bacterium]|nr:hypothetical protein [Alphaproteobacteria bacterium]